MHKRYIFLCPVCRQLADSTRNDKLTCSTACRVWLKRHPGFLDAAHASCKSCGTTVPLESIARAINMLCPELFNQICRRELSLEDAQPAVCRTFDMLVANAVKQMEQQQPTQ
jgi:hypothetical protein